MNQPSDAETGQPSTGQASAHVAGATALRRRWTDRLARSVVTGGGLTIIAGVLGILIFISLEVAPLFNGATTESKTTLSLDPSIQFVVVDEHQELCLVVGSTPRIDVMELGTGKLQSSQVLEKIENETITCAFRSFGSPRILLGTSSGRAIPVLATFRADFNEEGKRTIVPVIRERDPVLLDEKSHALHLAAVQWTDEGAIMATITDDARLLLGVLKETDTESEITRTDLTGALTSPPRSLALDRYLEKLYVGTDGGSVVEFDLQNGADPKPTATTRVGRTPISALSLLNGDRSLVVGEQDGRVSVWFHVADPSHVNGMRLTRIHELTAHGSEVRSIAVSERDRSFLTADQAGTLQLHHATTSHTLTRISSGSSPIRQVVLAPKSNGILALHENGALTRWSLRNPHPEVGIDALLGETWYEGYEKPEHVWQSTGGTDDFEPKLSMVPLIFGTLKGTFYALILAIPLAILSALYTSQFLHPSIRSVVKPAVEIMAALPSVVLGFLAGLWLAPTLERMIPAVLLMAAFLPLSTLVAMNIWKQIPAIVRSRSRGRLEVLLLVSSVGIGGWICVLLNDPVEAAVFGGDFRQWWFETTSLNYDQRNALVVGFAMGFAVIPIIFTISEDALSNVPRHLVSGSLALGATRWQTALRVVLPTASPGIFSAIMIGFGRAVGETMIVLMATGNTPIMDWNIFNGFRTLSANIAVEIPEAPHGGTLYRVLFLAALLLFLSTFVINTVAEIVRQRMRQRYAQL